MTFAAELELVGRSVLVSGGGARSMPTIRGLLDAGALVTVCASTPVATVQDLGERGLVTLHRRPAERVDLDGCALLVLASDDPGDDQDITAGARAVGIPVAHRDQPQDGADASGGSVTLVGGGPGDPGLITVAGMDAVRQADVLVCDRLAPLAALSHARPTATIIDVAKIPRGAFTSQDRINAILVEHALAGRRVVRLKGGDPFVFGRGGEEWQACTAAGVPVRIIPGVTSAVAVPALAGIPVTHRDLTQGFTVVSGHLAPGAPGSTLDWSALARTGTTLVVLMGVATLPAIVAALIEGGLASETPAVTVADGGLPSQRSVAGTLADIAERTQASGISPPAVTVIGAVAAFSPTNADPSASAAVGDADRG